LSNNNSNYYMCFRQQYCNQLALIHEDHSTFLTHILSMQQRMAEQLEGKTLMKVSNGQSSKVNASEHLKNKVVALYFSAHWCPPCRSFTPVLKDFYEEVGDKDFEVIFVSFDRSEADLATYLNEAHGDWCYLPFGDPLIRELSELYNVQGIPALIVIKPSGEVVTNNGRSEVMGQMSIPPAEVLKRWKTECGI
ncbi:Nucleoredoxin-like protein 2, partial [Trichinella nelsoni]